MCARFGGTLAAIAGLVSLAAIAHADTSGNRRIEFNQHADNDGTLVLRIAPLEGTPTDVKIRIPEKTSENSVADLTGPAVTIKPD